MPNPLDIQFYVPDEGESAGKMPRGAARQIANNVRLRAGTDCRIRVTLPVRSPKQNDTYWQYLGMISKAYTESGQDYPAALLHRWYKIRFLPVVAATLLAETGEEVEYRRTETYPDGTVEEREHTTTRLSRAAFTLYLDLIQADDEVQFMGVPFPSLAGLRGGRIYEPEELA